MLEQLKSHQVVVGSRYVSGGGVKNWRWYRKLLSQFANFYVKLILGFKISDVTSGFNAYRYDSIRKLNLADINSRGYAFLVELKYRLHELGLSFIEVPIIYDERREGQSKMSFRIMFESMKLPWIIKLKLWN